MAAEMRPQAEFSKVGIMLNVTENQENLLQQIRKNTLTIVSGPAGTGKTLCAVAEGIRLLIIPKGRVKKLIFIRPVVEAQEKLGFLPGDVQEKLEPYMAPLWSNVSKMIDGPTLKEIRKKIEIHPLAYLRGVTFEDSYVILDEAQNTNQAQMKLFLSRIGKRARVVIAGDTKQTDITGKNGLTDALYRLYGIPDIAICKLTKNDNMRSPLVERILDAYEEDEAPYYNKNYNDKNNLYK